MIKYEMFLQNLEKVIIQIFLMVNFKFCKMYKFYLNLI